MFRETSDILDRGSIAKLKHERIREEENNKEWEFFNVGINKLIKEKSNVPIKMFFDLLYRINSMIWELESDMRKGRLDGALSEVGRRAIEIRNLNGLRVGIKNIINKSLNEGFIDIKSNHLSE